MSIEASPKKSAKGNGKAKSNGMAKPGAGPAEAAGFQLIEHIPYEMDGGIASRASIGLVVLASDFTIEHEFRKMYEGVPGLGLYESRIYNSTTITPETLAAMEGDIARTADLILPGARLDVVGYGCTSASMVLGEEKIFKLIKSVRPKAKVTTPITAAFAAFDAFGAKRIGVLTPYRRDVNDIVRNYITKKGYAVPVFGSFNEENDTKVAHITGESVKRGIDAITRAGKVDMVFVSCTGVRLAERCADIERAIGLPVTSSNHAMAWHCLRLAGVDDKLPHCGSLYTR